MKKPWALSYPLSAQRRLISDWADAQADLSLRWAHTYFVGFVMSRLTWWFQISLVPNIAFVFFLFTSFNLEIKLYTAVSLYPNPSWDSLAFTYYNVSSLFSLLYCSFFRCFLHLMSGQSLRLGDLAGPWRSLISRTPRQQRWRSP